MAHSEVPIDKLLAGFQRFRERFFQKEIALFRQLATQGQSPRVAVVACCDARVDPAIITDCAPGDLFTLRNVANLVPPNEPEGVYHGTSAALEFAVCMLGVEHIVVMGHAQCGGIAALLADAHNGNRFIDAWMNIAREAREHVLADATLVTPAERAHACELDAVRVSLRNLLTFPWIRARVEAGQLRLHGWYFDLAAGRLMRRDPNTDRFE